MIPIDQLSIDVNQLSIDVNQLLIDVNQLSIDIDQLSIDVNQLSIDINQLSIDVDQLSIDVDQLSIDGNQIDPTPNQTKIRISLSSINLSRISVAFSNSRFFAASFISRVRRAMALSRSSPSVRPRRAFDVGPPGDFEVVKVGHLHQIAVDRFDDRGRLDVVLLVVRLLGRGGGSSRRRSEHLRACDYEFFTNGINLTKITNNGPLSNDRRHQFKASGIYNTPWKLSIGVSAYWHSGTPVTRYGYWSACRSYEFFLTSRGGEDRTPRNYNADVRLGYPIAFGGSHLNLLLEVFNILNTKRAVLLDQRYSFQESDDDLPKPANANYLKPVVRTPPTSARVGVRWTF